MEDLQETKPDYIEKILTSGKNSKWRGFILQHDSEDKVYSITLTERVPEELRERISELKERSKVVFHYKTSKGNDGKTYHNIFGADLIYETETFDDEPTNGGSQGTPRLTWTNRDLTELIRIACNNANANVIKIQEKTEKPIDPKDILQLIDDFTHFWFNIELVLWHRE